MNTKNFYLIHEQDGEDGIRTHKVHLGVLIFIIYCFYIILYNFKINIIQVFNFTCMNSLFLKNMINMGGYNAEAIIIFALKYLFLLLNFLLAWTKMSTYLRPLFFFH